jgi:SAM-dependent methyltransferase
MTSMLAATALPLYDALAPIYDAWQAADDATPFALLVHDKLERELGRAARAPVRSFLDLGCGTGALPLALARAHADWRLAGVDASAGMLAHAARRPGAERVAWLRASLARPLPLRVPFDAAGAFYDTLNHLPDAGALQAALAAAAGVLRPGGLFAFDLTNALGFERWWRGRNQWHGDGWRLTVATRYDPPARTGSADVMLERDGVVSRFSLVERWFTDSEVRQALAAAGLRVHSAEPWSPFAIDAPGKTWWISTKST